MQAQVRSFKFNFEKSQFTPVETIVWLGFSWNLRDGILEIPNEKIQNISSIVDSIIRNSGHTSARKISSFVGKVISLKPAIGSICQLMTRHLSMAICLRFGWDCVIKLSPDCMSELSFWSKNLFSLPNVRSDRRNSVPEKIMFSDASDFAGAGFSVERDSKIVHYMWNNSERSKSSTWRELKTISVIIESLHKDLTGKIVKIYTDNQNILHAREV